MCDHPARELHKQGRPLIPNQRDGAPVATGVVVPDALAGEVLRRLVRDLERETRQSGARVSLRCSVLLLALHRAAERYERGPGTGAEQGTSPAEPTSVEISVADAAELLGCSATWITRLARGGRIAGRRVGRTWLLDRASLDDYRGSAA